MSDTTIYAIVEIMGRRQRAGAISDATVGGATMLRVEHPTRTDHNGEPLAEYYSPQALFAVRPCSREQAEAVNQWAWPEPSTRPALPAAAEDAMEEACGNCGAPLNDRGFCEDCEPF